MMHTVIKVHAHNVNCVQPLSSVRTKKRGSPRCSFIDEEQCHMS